MFVEFPSRRDAAEPYVDAMMSRTINTPSSSLQAVGKPLSRGPPLATRLPIAVRPVQRPAALCLTRRPLLHRRHRAYFRRHNRRQQPSHRRRRQPAVNYLR